MSSCFFPRLPVVLSHFPLNLELLPGRHTLALLLRLAHSPTQLAFSLLLAGSEGFSQATWVVYELLMTRTPEGEEGSYPVGMGIGREGGGGGIMELFREREVVRICAPMVRYSK